MNNVAYKFIIHNVLVSCMIFNLLVQRSIKMNAQRIKKLIWIIIVAIFSVWTTYSLLNRLTKNSMIFEWIYFSTTSFVTFYLIHVKLFEND